MNPLQAQRRTPLAWRQISHRPMRLLAAIAGVGFANVLVFFQMGLASGLYASQKRPLQRLTGELVMVSRRYTNLGEPLNMPRSRLIQALGVRGVKAVTPLYIGKIDWLNRDSHEKRQALIFGLTPENPALYIPELATDTNKLLRPDGLFFDTLSKKAAGPVATVVAKEGFYDTELRGKRAVVNGLFTMGLTFAADINLLSSASNFKNWFPDQSSDDIQLGVIQLEAGASPQQVQATLASFLDPAVKVLTLKQLEEVEVDHWRNNTSFGLIFNLGVLVGLVVGAIIVYQILYSDVSDHLPEYATMKAIGYGNSFIVGVIIQESLLLAALAFLPSMLLAMGLYAFLASSTSLLIAMTTQRAVLVFSLTLATSAGSGWLATGKLRRLDPAEIF